MNAIDTGISNLVSAVADLASRLFSIPGYFIGSNLSSGPLFTLLTTVLDNTQVKQIVFLLLITGGPLLIAMGWNRQNSRGGKISRTR